MMKNLLVFTITVLIAQIGFSQLTFDADTAILIMEDGVANKAKIRVSNNSGHDINLRWSLINSTLNDNDDGDSDNSNNWALQFCECNTCYSNDFSGLVTAAACADPMLNSSSLEWYLTVDPNGQPMTDAEWVIKVDNITDNETDTLSFFAKNPLSVTKVSANATVSSYPNPANSELVVNYDLTNVSIPTLNVYNIVGSKIGVYPMNRSNGTFRLNTQSFENGLYFFTIENEGQRVFLQKFNVVH